MDSLSVLEYVSIGILIVLVLILAVVAIIASRLRTDDVALPAWLERLAREPALVAGVVGAAAALTAAFGLELTAEQVGAVVGVLSVVLGIVVRQSVTPVRARPPIEGSASE